MQHAQQQPHSLRLLQEVGILKGLNYDRNIVQFYGACLMPARDPMLICEYMEGVSLCGISAHHGSQRDFSIDSKCATARRCKANNGFVLQWCFGQIRGPPHNPEVSCFRRRPLPGAAASQRFVLVPEGSPHCIGHRPRSPLPSLSWGEGTLLQGSQSATAMHGSNVRSGLGTCLACMTSACTYVHADT
jgi:hypothetical protein